MQTLTIEVIEDGNIEQCRELCNELMTYQMAQARMDPERFTGMNFDTRMKQSYESALHSHIAVVKDGSEPVGYVFSTIDTMTEAARAARPSWAPKTGTGLLPDWVELPQNIGCLSNLYFRDAYRGRGLGTALVNSAVKWMESFADVHLQFVYISNGNDAALQFYLRNGFTYSHDVFGGFITAAYRVSQRTIPESL